MIAATTANAPALAALHAAVFPKAERWGADAISVMLEMRGAFGLHLPLEGFVLARIAADEAELMTLAVIPAVRRQGVGGALLAGAISTAATRGATAMFLEVSTRNTAARALYAAAGFAEVGRRARYYVDGTDAVILRKNLNPA